MSWHGSRGISIDWLTRSAPALPAVLLMVVVWTAFILFMTVKDHLENAIGKYAVDKMSAMAYRACLLWMTSFIAFALMATWLSSVSTYPILKYMDERYRRSAFIGSVGVIFFGMAAWHRLPFYSGGRSLLDPLEHTLRAKIIRITTVGYGVGSASVCLMIFACVALGLRADTPTISDLRRRFDLAKLMLFSSAGLLAVSVAHVYFLYDWPWRVQDVTKPYINNAHEMARATAIAYAIIYTAFLVAAHLPLSVIQEFQIHDLMPSDTADHRKWKIQNGLDRSPVSTLAELLAMAGPLLTAIGLPKLLMGS